MAVDGKSGAQGNVTFCFSLNTPAMLGTLTRETNGSITVQMLVAESCRIRLEASNDLSLGQAGWSNVASFDHQSAGSFTHNDTGAIGQNNRFYRLVAP